MNLGIIARADKTGLGNQTRNLVRMLKPFRVMVIDSRPFNKNEQFFNMYEGLNVQIVHGFPTDNDVYRFLRGLDTVLTCELFYNNRFITIAEATAVRTYNQYNYEFLDNLANPRLPLPTKLLSPSKWHLEEMQQRYPDKVVYLPPPTFSDQYTGVREYNYSITGKPRFLHIVGRMAVNDRNGTLDLLQALAYTKEDFELVLKVQTSSPVLEQYQDERIHFDYDSPQDETYLYQGFHALILPRRYAGLCLPMNEALMSGLPVLMTDVDPNNKILPEKWLVPATKQGSFHTRTNIDLYSVNHKDLAAKIDKLCKQIKNNKFKKEQEQAYNLAYENYSAEVLLPKYQEIIV